MIKILVFTLVFAAQVAPADVCFAPEEACAEKLTLFLGSAQKSLDIAIYDINLEPVVHEILVQSKKIKVRVLVDKVQSKGKHSAVSTLIKAGVDVRLGHQRGIMHNKFAIVDQARLETGSFNYTHHASLANQENQIYLADAETVHRFHERFEMMWSKGRIPTSGSSTSRLGLGP
jgi:phosphatidylserine/phosphatidylglycerophosphate/cardiolipin synthase-like enzyme